MTLQITSTQAQVQRTFCIVLCITFFVTVNMAKCGGTGEIKQATEETQKIADEVRSAAEGKANEKFEKYVAVSYKSQVVAGTNYFIKVDVGSGRFVHLRVYQPLPYTGLGPELSGIQLNKTSGDELKYFEPDQ